MSLSVLVVGEARTGKTSLINRMMNEDFREEYVPTTDIITPIHFPVKTGNLSGMVEICFWDTNGEKYKELDSTSYYNDQDVYIVVYDVTNQHSLPLAHDTMEHIGLVMLNNRCRIKPLLFLIGNKMDGDRQISQIDAQKFAVESKAEYLETSAKTGENVKELLETILKKHNLKNNASRRSLESMSAANYNLLPATRYYKKSSCCVVL